MHQINQKVFTAHSVYQNKHSFTTKMPFVKFIHFQRKSFKKQENDRLTTDYKILTGHNKKTGALSGTRSSRPHAWIYS